MTTLGLSAFRWSTSHVWKSFRCVGSSFQVSDAGPRVLALEREVADEHHADDRRGQRHAAAPPRPVLDEQGSGGDVDVGERRHRYPLSPAIAFRAATRSTTPTTAPFSTAETGSSLDAITGTASLIVVCTSSVGPPSSPGSAGRA